MPTRRHIVVVGAGLAGLAAARTLADAGHDATVVEASDRAGGRVASDRIETGAGLATVDRGFQVYLSAYAEPKRFVDLARLDLRAFMPGALVWDGMRAGTVAHPLREPLAAIAGVLRGLVPPRDALRMIPFARAALRGPAACAGAAAGVTALARLEAAGLSPATIDRFFRSFFGGVFFDRSLRTDASRLDYLLRMFAEGFACVPARGMGAIADEMAAPVRDRIRLGARVARLEGTTAVLASGERLDADAVVLATGADDLRALVPGLPEVAWCGTFSAWFLAPDASALPRWLVLNGSGRGAFNHGAAMSSVAPEYAPAGRGLFVANSASLPKDADQSVEVAEDMRRTLSGILGPRAVDGWRLVATQRIARAIPRQWPEDLATRASSAPGPRTFVAGDHLEDASINGAVRSGRLAAERCIAALATA